jgi:serine/threonine protein kinase
MVDMHPLQEIHIHHSRIMEGKAGDPYLGRIIRGYCLEELLGRGKLTAVYRARTEELWQIPELMITIVLIPEELSKQAQVQFKARFIHHARKLIKLRHHHLFPLYGYGEQDGIFYLLSPPIHGETLTNHSLYKKPWSATETLAVLLPLASVLDYLHGQGLVYQFFSPANILLQNNQTVLLSSLGLAQLLSMNGLEQERPGPMTYGHLQSIAGTFLGAPEYLAPEVVKGAEIDKRSDIYSLGILLFELLSGTTPFTGKSYVDIAQKHIKEPLPALHEISPELPIALELVVNRALQRNPDRRFQTVGEFITVYSHVIDERINAPRSVNLVQTIEHMKVLPAPKTGKAVAEEQEKFLLMGKDTLFPTEPKMPALTNTEPGKSLSTTNIDVSVSRAPSASSQETHNNDMAIENSHETAIAKMGAMANQLQHLKERLQAQSTTAQPDDIQRHT